MSRKIKNLIMILLMVALVGSMAGTAYFAKSQQSSAMNEMNGGASQTPPSNSGTGTEDQDSSDSKTNTEDQSSSDSGTSRESQDSSDSSESVKPSAPSDGQQPNENMPGNGEKNGDRHSGNGGGMVRFSGIGLKYILIFGLESLAFAAILLYLIMSEANKKSPGETFVNTDKILIYVLALIILTEGCTAGTSLAASKYISSSITAPSGVEQTIDQGDGA